MTDQQANQTKKQKKKKKAQKLKARQPRGFVDRQASDIRATESMMAKIKEVYERYGFDPVETPMFEYTDALGKFLPDTDRPNAGVFSLQDDDEQWMSLRYDLTAPLARHFAQNINDLQTPYRTYRAGYVFRNEKPGPGRFRQFMQFDADTVGAPNPSADAEMCMMMADTMEALGIKRGDYVVRVNSRKILDGLMDYIGLSGDENEGRRLGILRSIDKLDRLGIDEVQKLLSFGRRDSSGDWTEGVRLKDYQLKTLSLFLTLQNAVMTGVWPSKFRRITRKISDEGDAPEIVYDFIEEDFNFDIEKEKEDQEKFGNATALVVHALGLDPNSDDWGSDKLGDASGALKVLRAVNELMALTLLCASSGYFKDRIIMDLTCVRGLEYYTGAVYECELTFPVINEKGQTVTFGSVAGGGRYDGLVKRFTGQDIPATGFSIGVSRLMTALKNLGKLETDDVLGPVVVCVMDRDDDSLAGYQQMVQEMRNAGIRAEMYQGNPKQFGKQLQYADRRGSPIAIIEGSQEREEGVVQVKDLVEGAKLAEEINDNKEWRESRPAQQTVKRENLLATVQKILAEQKAERDV